MRSNEQDMYGGTNTRMLANSDVGDLGGVERKAEASAVRQRKTRSTKKKVASETRTLDEETELGLMELLLGVAEDEVSAVPAEPGCNWELARQEECKPNSMPCAEARRLSELQSSSSNEEHLAPPALATEQGVSLEIATQTVAELELPTSTSEREEAETTPVLQVGSDHHPQATRVAEEEAVREPLLGQVAGAEELARENEESVAEQVEKLVQQLSGNSAQVHEDWAGSCAVDGVAHERENQPQDFAGTVACSGLEGASETEFWESSVMLHEAGTELELAQEWGALRADEMAQDAMELEVRVGDGIELGAMEQVELNPSSCDTEAVASEASRSPHTTSTSAAVTQARRGIVDSCILPPTLGMTSVRGVVGRDVSVAQLQHHFMSQVVTRALTRDLLSQAKSHPVDSAEHNLVASEHGEATAIETQVPLQSQAQAMQSPTHLERQGQASRVNSPTEQAQASSATQNRRELELDRLLGFNSLSKLFTVTEALQAWTLAWSEGKLPLPCAPTPASMGEVAQGQPTVRSTGKSEVPSRSFIFPWEQVFTSSKELRNLVAPWLVDRTQPSLTQPQLLELELWYWTYQYVTQQLKQALTRRSLEMLAHYLGLVRGVHTLGANLDSSRGVWQVLPHLREISVAHYQVKDAHAYQDWEQRLQAHARQQLQARIEQLRARLHQLRQAQSLRQQLGERDKWRRESSTPSSVAKLDKESYA